VCCPALKMPMSVSLGMSMSAAMICPAGRFPRGFVGVVPWLVGEVSFQSSTSVTAARAAVSSTRDLLLAKVATRACRARLFDRSRVAAGGAVDQADRVVAKQWVGAAGQAEMMLDVAAGLGAGHAGHGVAQRGGLFQRGQDGELHGAP